MTWKTINLFVFFFLASAQIVGAALWPLDPQTTAPPINHLACDYNGDYFHDGIDIPASAGSAVKSISNGVVSKVDSAGMGQLVIIRESPGDTEGWCYAHIDVDKNVIYEGATVNIGQTIGTVFSGWLPPFVDHLHFARRAADNPDNWKYVNPFQFYNSVERPSQVMSFPVSNVQFARDTSGNVIPNFFVDSSSGITIVYGDVDAIAEPHTTVQGNPNPGIYALNFRVQGGPPNSAEITERLMVQFDDLLNPDDNKLSLCYARTSSQFQGKYIVTNCRSKMQLDVPSDGGSNLVENSWHTKLVVGADEAELPPYPNVNAKINAEAKYKDGSYEFVVTAKTYANAASKSVTAPVVADNFAPFVRGVEATQGGTTRYLASWPEEPVSEEDLGDLTPTLTYSFNRTEEITISITFSETMDQTALPGVGMDEATPETGEWISDRMFRVAFPVDSLTEACGDVALKIGGAKDRAGNYLDADPKTISARDASGAWQRFETGGAATDENHVLMFSECGSPAWCMGAKRPAGRRGDLVHPDAYLLYFGTR